MVTAKPFTTASPVVASYDYYDLDEGAGYVKYYGFAADTSSATTYGLTKQTPFSDPISSGVAGTGTQDMDFDITFNFPKTLKGNLIANIPIYASCNIDAGSRTSVVLNIIHYDGTTETNLGTATSDYIENAGANTTQNKVVCFDISATEKHFASGDTLRLNVIATNTRIDGSAAGGILHDPQGRTPTQTGAADFESSVLSFEVPFKLDI